jgi:large subunit ribosomal protein L31
MNTGRLAGRPHALIYWGFAQGLKEFAVKPEIHPTYHDVEARCACGATWKTRSTKKELHLEICSNCHPFFTGRQKLIDTEGRVERFTKKFGAQTVEGRKAGAAKPQAKPAAAKAPRIKAPKAPKTAAPKEKETVQ